MNGRVELHWQVQGDPSGFIVLRYDTLGTAGWYVITPFGGSAGSRVENLFNFANRDTWDLDQGTPTQWVNYGGAIPHTGATDYSLMDYRVADYAPIGYQILQYYRGTAGYPATGWLSPVNTHSPDSTFGGWPTQDASDNLVRNRLRIMPEDDVRVLEILGSDDMMYGRIKARDRGLNYGGQSYSEIATVAPRKTSVLEVAGADNLNIEATVYFHDLADSNVLVWTP